MHEEICKLILAYKKDLDDTENSIKAVNERYGNIIGYNFETYDGATQFVKILLSPVGHNAFICLNNRCPNCFNPLHDGFYSYTDDDELTIAAILEFCIYLRKVGIMCEHEFVESIQVSDIMCLINLKCQQNALENSDPI